MKTLHNRQRLLPLLGNGSAVIITSNDILPSNSDGVFGFRQNNDLYWLTGINQEDTAVFIFPEHPDPAKREVLFIKYVNDDFVKWHGRRLTLEEASEISGIGNVMWHHQLYDFLKANAYLIESFCLQTTDHPRSENRTQTANDRLIVYLRENYPLHGFKRVTPLLSKLRSSKSEEEIALLQKACDITTAGFNRVLKFVRPGVREKQIEAEMIHEYLQYNGDWSGYDPIVASGADSCILHYISNHKTCVAGDLLLIDAAASFGLYNADLTRAIPVSGRYSKRQRELYDSVLRVHRAMTGFIKAGIYFRDIQQHAGELLCEEYVRLKLCTGSELRSKGANYFMQKYSYHGFAHYLGLDVHDVGNTYEPLPENAVTTVEPGIYITEEGIGVRIENNLVVKKDGCIDLMRKTPIEAEEIEEIMNA